MTRARLVGLLAAVLLGTAAGPVATAPAAQAAAGYCPRGTGVTVVVDNGAAGGGSSVRCDPGGAGTVASTVVPRAGYPLTYVVRQPGFVCRVAGRPASAPCQNTPPANAYWGLFWSDGRSGTWNYANVGVGSLKVPAGGFIGFRWQSGGRTAPGPAPVGPAAATPAPKPTPRPTARPSTRPTPRPSSKPPATRTPRPAPPATNGSTPYSGRRSDAPPSASTGARNGQGSATPQPSSRAGAGAKRTKAARPSTTPTPTASPSSDPTAAAAGSSDPSAQAAPASDVDLTSSEEGTDPVLTIAAGGLLVLLLGAAGVLAWRRRT